MSMAKEIASKLSSQAWKAITFGGGYAIPYSGERYLFDPMVLLQEARNKGGRVIRARFKCADGSVLFYSWSESRGPIVREDMRK